MNEKITKINEIDICTESFGNSEDPAVLLIMGAMCSMVYWDEEFCHQLADTGRYVIRYDNRDVGRSTTYEPGSSHYTVVDMADDAVGVLDAYHIDEAHIVGMSLGGMIAQIIALRNPQRVLSITLIASGIFGSEDNKRNLPSIDEKILAYHANATKLNWSDEESVANYLVAGSALLCGSKHKFDEKRVYKQVENEIKRANNLLSMFNHSLLKGDDFYEGKLKGINIPTLVIHGTEDTVLPYEHSLALVNEIPHALLLTLEGSGHEIHCDDWVHIINAISNHTSVL
ncbi:MULTISPECIES: alpha/beta hydrolase [unclassified Bacillus (in: firmicutes)]|uniref:alpha/beta fold hydrolase n=1 Tax=unclassified Bacillus (in: firmicutes) TaxID=185979 RepID=UPI0023DAD467|nr:MULTISPECIES: alpha/beta hydrolase [unclassified Bacillus (in: firmicutes)]MCU4759476.1 alpha/beta fold hydrolase [Bacillus cereus]MCU5109470.1 alpha/beta fold hydrolase [Bacillus cereus]MCU5342389.1 alpha/beta fold hydrolase [Bacillus cereus]MDF2022067.1 alpha/beta hydrolase [Bacillus sp. Cr_R3]MDF2035340.1 alpha/beta hydrolase [Bacillus sp. Cr_R16]